MECSPIPHKRVFKPLPNTSVSILPHPIIRGELTLADLAIVTALFLASYNIGSALGSSIAGAIWSQTLVSELTNNLGNATLAAEVYADPFTFAENNPVGTPDRDAVVLGYMHTQRILCIAGICLTVPLIAFSLCIRDPKLTKEQSLKKAEESDSE